MRKKIWIPFLFLLFNSFFTKAQTCDWKFVQHLIQEENYRDAQILLQEVVAKNDTVTFLKGWCLLKSKQPDSALLVWQNCHSKTQLGAICSFYSSLLNLYEHEYSKGVVALKSIDTLQLNTNEKLLQQIFATGFFIAQKQFSSADSVIKKFQFNNFMVSDGQKEIIKTMQLFKTAKHRSAFLAGLFSSIIPGSGKWYAGNLGGALGGFIVCAGLGGVAYEQYKKPVYKSINVVVSASAFAFFYVGNIIGSVFVAKIHRENIEKENFNYLLRVLQIAADQQFSPNQLFQ